MISLYDLICNTLDPKHFWKKEYFTFSQDHLSSSDLFCSFQVDKDFIPGLMYIRDNEATAEEFEGMSLPFTVPNASGQDIQLSSKYSHITLENRAEYVRLAINYR